MIDRFDYNVTKLQKSSIEQPYTLQGRAIAATSRAMSANSPADPVDPIEPIAVRTLIAAYASGIFPMADSRDDSDIYWVEPKRRAILPLDAFQLSRSLAKTLRRGHFRVTSDACFSAVVAACAEAAPGRETTWINAVIERSYAGLFAAGFAHSIECWAKDELVGGLYGVAIGRAFFGESMFSRRTDASKVALAHLVARLRAGGYRLLDCQFMTTHLASLGAIEMSQAAYLRRLQPAVAGAFAGGAGVAVGAGAAAGGAAGVPSGGAGAGLADWGALDALAGAAAAGRAAPGSASSDISTSPGQLIVQLLTNTS